MSKLKVFVGFSEVAGFYSLLCQGLSQSGHKVTFRSFGPNPYSYSIESNPTKIQLLIWKTNSLYLSCTNPILKLPLYLLHVTIRILFILPLMLRSDLILLNYTGTLFFYLDIFFLRALGKRIVYLFHGSDSRAPYFNGKYIFPTYSLQRLRRLTLVTSARIRLIEILRCTCVVPPAVSHLFRRKVVTFSVLGLPWPPVLDQHSEPEQSHKSSAFTVVHAPSNSINKGTSLIRQSVKDLQQEGINLNYVELSGASNTSVIRAIKSADLIIDQLWSDARLCGFGAEAATYGIPTLIGTHYTERLWNDHSNFREPYVITTEPDDLTNRLRHLILDPTELHSLRTKLPTIGTLYEPKIFSDRLLHVLNTSPDHANSSRFWFDPLSCNYLYGWGAPAPIVISTINAFVAKYGMSALCLPRNSASFIELIQLIK